jgi:hypothetical protein
MIDLDDIKLYLPKYLSPETEQKLLEDLSEFPSNIDERMYTNLESEIIFQGDCIKNLLIISLPNTETMKTNSIIISNTCDIDVSNKRKFSSNIIYTPLIKLEKYKELLISYNIYSETSIKNHIEDIKKQRITQIFYLPPSEKINEENIVFFDRVCSCDNRYLKRSNISEIRLFSLSQYGFYLFLFKLSIHFTRMYEGIDRTY